MPRECSKRAFLTSLVSRATGNLPFEFGSLPLQRASDHRHLSSKRSSKENYSHPHPDDNDEARENGCGSRRKKTRTKVPACQCKQPPSARQSASRRFGRAERHQCNAVNRHGKHVLDCILRVKARETGKGKHARASRSPCRRRNSLRRSQRQTRGDLPRCVARRALGAARQRGLTAKAASRKAAATESTARKALAASAAAASADQRAHGARNENGKQEDRFCGPPRGNRARFRSFRPTSRRCSSRLPKSAARRQKRARETRESFHPPPRCSSFRPRTRPAGTRIERSTRLR